MSGRRFRVLRQQIKGNGKVEKQTSYGKSRTREQADSLIEKWLKEELYTETKYYFNSFTISPTTETTTSAFNSVALPTMSP